MVLRVVASLAGGAVVLYEDVTLDRAGNVTERHGYELDDAKATDGDRVALKVEAAADGRALASVSRQRDAKQPTERVRRELALADRATEPRVVVSWERAAKRSVETGLGDGNRH